MTVRQFRHLPCAGGLLAVRVNTTALCKFQQKPVRGQVILPPNENTTGIGQVKRMLHACRVR